MISVEAMKGNPVFSCRFQFEEGTRKHIIQDEKRKFSLSEWHVCKLLFHFYAKRMYRRRSFLTKNLLAHPF
ncbi:hypothetical protein XI25_22505 [Paenibacillus sp. DMB20]|nr:hypothetical protein XI25_22505 [Paenibacillus sp. DMB20]